MSHLKVVSGAPKSAKPEPWKPTAVPEDHTLPEPVFADEPAIAEPALTFDEVFRVLRWLSKWSRLEGEAVGCMANAALKSIHGMIFYFNEGVDDDEAPHV